MLVLCKSLHLSVYRVVSNDCTYDAILQNTTTFSLHIRSVVSLQHLFTMSVYG